MAISITTAEVKRKAMIASGDTSHDSDISSLITEMQGAVEHSIADCYYNDTSNTKLQATLKLGILEIITGEFLEQLRRGVGAAEQFSIAGVSVGVATENGLDLMQQGATRLESYLKSALPMMSENSPASTTTDDDTTFSLEEEVW